MSDTKISEAAPAVYGIRVKGNLAIVGVLPVPLKDFPVKNPEWDERYEEVPLYLHPQPAELAEKQIQPVNADEAPFGLTTAEKVAWARGANDAIKEYALAATGKQQVGEQKPYAPEGYSIIADHNLDALRRRAEIPTRIERGEVWYWQGNGEDFPGSLNCPVIMHADTLRALLTSRQQVGENPAWRDELVREAHARGLMEGLNSPRPQQGGEVQGDAVEHAKNLDLLRAVYHVDAEPRAAALNAAIAALAARQPAVLIAQKVGDYRVTVAEDTITVSHGRDIVFAYSAGDAEPVIARQPVAQEAFAWGLIYGGERSVSLDRHKCDDGTDFDDEFQFPLYAAPPAQKESKDE